MVTHRTLGIARTVSLSLSILLVATVGLWARVTTPQEARWVVAGWLADNVEPFGLQLGRDVAHVETFPGHAGEPICYLVRLSPSGFVIVSADDLVEPIIAFADTTDYEPAAEDPLTALVISDLNERIAAAYDQSPGQLRMQSLIDARSKWHELMSRASLPPGGIGPLGRQTLSDVRVAPLVKTRWAQGSVCSSYCYNYYTPNNYLAGCVATAMAQLMHYHRYPALGIGRRSFAVRVAGMDQTVYTRGGNGTGGPYPWDDMVLSPNCSTTARQRQAIGALCFDAGASVRMEYGATVSNADAFAMADGLKTAFKFSNAVNGANGGKNIATTLAGLAGMINSNLDAELPVLLAIVGSSGHAVVADGYGYDLAVKTRTLYHHINMGWGGADDMWYNLPDAGKYNSVVTCVYNIFPEGQGEIISGRVMDASSRPVAGAVVRARFQTAVYEATTNAGGIYALARVPSAATFSVEVHKPGLVFAKQTVATDTSRDWKAVTGNRWGIDFVGTPSADSDNDGDVDFADFAVLAGRPWNYFSLAAFVASWLTGVSLEQGTPAEPAVDDNQTPQDRTIPGTSIILIW
jgi:hypothetical protein